MIFRPAVILKIVQFLGEKLPVSRKHKSRFISESLRAASKLIGLLQDETQHAAPLLKRAGGGASARFYNDVAQNLDRAVAAFCVDVAMGDESDGVWSSVERPNTV